MKYHARIVVAIGGILGVFACVAFALTFFRCSVTDIAPSAAPPERNGGSAARAQDKPRVVPSATLIFVGDIMLGRFVETLTAAHGAGYPFVHISSTLRAADAVIGNLEGPVRLAHVQTPIDSLQMSFASSVVPALHDAGFTHLSLANNHSLDFGMPALTETRDALSRYGIEPFGSPRNATDTMTIVSDVSGRRVALVGVNGTLPAMNATATEALISSLRAKEPGAYIAVFIHWGEKYEPKATASQQELAHRFIRAGADAIFGHHPHVVQNIERYDGKPIFYSLGNFVFDQYFRDDTQQALMVRVRL